ncbi:hypothetical protein EXIGLDRAFT_735538 [Exidia glandulosa HHB12029]|uniref:HAT C-terminal dimerisation domain-containing protein n=1 Tax=Exidia glandulosa HHB12029 TaxID=1314781 RepID=A0A165JRD4_EXIGL|nr:hypothetical protein EXIGLDRAFT_735538 [Exidia glandulosa HHB12029]
MGSSVSSERSFSSGNLIVTSQRSSLQPDIVEALQSVKCALQNDLLIREPPPSSAVEAALVVEDSDDDNDGGDKQSEANQQWVIELASDDDDGEESEGRSIDDV